MVKDGDLAYANAFGLADGPHKIAATPDTAYSFWSMTKVFTGVAILQLHERGLLSLDAPVRDYLGFFDVRYPTDDSPQVTVRHLLNHSAGMSSGFPAIFRWVHLDGEPEWNQTALIKEKLPEFARLEFEPGTQGKYSNIGYMVLAAIVEAMSAQTYERYIIDNILRPLGMDSTDFFFTESVVRTVATSAHPHRDVVTWLLHLGYDDPARMIREIRDGVVWFNRILSDQNGPTGLIGPPTDVARFLMAYMNGGELNGQRILSQRSIDMMTRESWITPDPSTSTPRYYHGLSWWVVPDGDRFLIQHAGDGPGGAPVMRIYPHQGLGLVLMTNGYYLDRSAILDQLAGLAW